MNTIVNAKSISDTKIHYSCPFCFQNTSGKIFGSQHYKNGKVAKGRAPTVHHHGNETQRLDNFTRTGFLIARSTDHRLKYTLRMKQKE